MQFKTLERKATRLAGHVAKTGYKLLDAGKTKLAIGKEEHAIDELYYKIGEAVYAQSMAGGEVPSYIESDIAAINEHLRRVEELKQNAKAKSEEDSFDSDSSADEYDDIIIDITSDSENE